MLYCTYKFPASIVKQLRICSLYPRLLLQNAEMLIFQVHGQIKTCNLYREYGEIDAHTGIGGKTIGERSQ